MICSVSVLCPAHITHIGEMPRTLKSRKLLAFYIVPSFVIISTLVAAAQVGFTKEKDYHPGSRHLLQTNDNSSLFQCIPSGISSFPGDFFTQAQRLRGGVVVHMLLTGYICAMIAVVCDDYFIPSLDTISGKLKLPPDIAGATFMAIGTSAPELFSSITGSFITEGDIGVGTIIGSAVFNILAVTGVVGLILWDEELDIDWYPIARDCTIYGLTIGVLIWIIYDNIVTWWESTILLAVFFLYILVICFNKRVEKCTKNMVQKIKKYLCCCCENTNEEKLPLLGQQILVPELRESQTKQCPSERDSFSVEFIGKENLFNTTQITAEVDEIILNGELIVEGTLCSPPSGGPWNYVWWILMYPANIIFFLTIPDSRKEKLQGCYPITFLMSVLWIGILSYLAVWMVTIIGFTFSIPDSVSGLTILAAGTSVPEVMTSVIVAKGGFGNMAISNLVGSNTFDISFCLGAPWLAKTLISKKGYLIVYSNALTYTTGTLLLTLVGFVLVFQLWHWKINRAVGLTCLVIYTIFVLLACLYEMNVFGEINVPNCAT